MACSSGDQNFVQYKIFLSHAGMEKDFVEQLYKDLDKFYPGRIFFDKDSLPYGEKFPERIFDAARNCEVAVIVISMNYFKRKWPMTELAEFFSSQIQFPEKKILPLFYKLSVEEFKRSERQDEWFKEWEKIKNEIDDKGKLKNERINEKTLEAWKDALQRINPVHGIEMIRGDPNGIGMDSGEGEVSYRERIVKAICDLVPPVTEFDVSVVEGQDRICTFFREKLERFDKECSPRFFGMYAMGGMGKTTMSRVLCNEFSSEFLGKVCHVELNNHAIIDLRKALLRTLTKWSESDMIKFTDESKVLHLLKQHVPSHRLFLVVDNVWDEQKSRQEAQSFLSLPFKKGSVVLVTARSEEILNLFKNIIPWTDRFSTPFLDTHAATNLFLNSAGYKSLLQLEPKKKDLTKTFVESCCFSMPGSLSGGEYHPLALRVLGGYVGQYTGPWENIKIDFKRCGENEKIDPLFSVLEIGWEGLSTKCRTLFLDSVQFFQSYYADYEVGDFVEWYCTIFGVEEAEVREWLGILKRRSILTFEYGDGEYISVHDLYREFATREANKCTHSRTCILHDGRDNGHYRRKKLAIHGSKIISLTKQELCKCSTDVEILLVTHCQQLTKVNLRGMKKLLSIEFLDCGSLEQVDLDDLQSLVWLHIYTKRAFLMLSIKGLKSLQVLKVWCTVNCSQSRVCESFHDCTSLIELEIEGYPELLEFPDLSNSRKLRRFKGRYCPKTKSLPGLSNFKDLRHLWLDVVGLTDIQGLDLLNKLEELHIMRCSNLKAIPNLSNVGLTLRKLSIVECYHLESVPSLSNLFSLKVLCISNSKQIEEIHGVEELQNLKRLICDGTSIRFLPDLSMLTNLVHINVSATPIQEIGGLPENLEEFIMIKCAHAEEISNSVAYKTWTSLGANKFKKSRHS